MTSLTDPEAEAGRRSRLVTALVAAAIVVVGALWVVGPYLTEDRDYPEGLDSPAVREAAGAACRDMRAEIDGAGFEVRNAAVERMVARIREVGPEALRADVPAESWLADWEALVAARRAAGGPDYEVPVVDGDRITRRMDELAKDLRPCQVPEELLPPRG